MAGAKKPVVEQRGSVTVVLLGPDFENVDEAVLEDASSVILEVSQTANPPLVVVDLSHTKFFGSAFIETLFRAWNRLNAEEGGRFCISGLTPYCREVIEVTHLDRLWTLSDTVDEAVATLSAEND
ncbi:MAG: STAS domain-containing protein [Planctomycetaceae bacterium]|jgi:anti-sigma B factor antagonist|nr:STAS domain-containing protein [Planctomycetaceae bacterium]MBT6488024.1 STAS domain-containing protein [Planctomycetaceae bacterium]MBT6497837.1 STAS domain-containing protein [Planctomycetaceae bacterium]